VKDENDAALDQVSAGEFTDWIPLPAISDLLFYEGLHGGVATTTWTRRRSSPARVQEHQPERRQDNAGIDVTRYVDLLIGVVPIVNLEWIQKISRDCNKGKCTLEGVTSTILRRMNDYINIIVPQFSLTDINFQRVPLVDTSNPFESQDVPSADESLVVIHFRNPQRHDFPALMTKISGAFMSRPNTMVVPGGNLAHAMEVICTPIILSLIQAT
jgi:phosphoribulokinase